MPRRIEPNEFGHRFDIGLLPEELLRLLPLRRAAVASRDRIDEHQIGDRQNRVFIVDELKRRGWQRAVFVDQRPSGTEPTEMQPDSRRTGPPIEAEQDRSPGCVGVGHEGVGDEEDVCLEVSLLRQERQHARLGPVG